MITVAPARMVTIAMYETISGVTQGAVRRRIEDGIWTEGREYHRRHGGVYVDLQGVDRWVAGQQRAA